MSLLDLRMDDTLRALPRTVAPVVPEQKFSVWGATTALPRSVLTASAEVMASASELAYAPFKRKSVDTPAEAMRNDFADALRDRGREFAPDPQTASTAEQLIYGFGRAASKVVAGAVVAGPVGVLGAGLEEANTVSVDLADKGVDSDTRKRAAAVQGAGLALAVLPLVGQTLRATAALYVAGGPGAFVAQQALTRQIMQQGGYDKMAEQYDPFDPVGLAVSALVPLPFVALGVRGQRVARAQQAERKFQAGPLPSEPAPVAAAVQAYPAEVVDAARVMFGVERRQASTLGDMSPAAMDLHEAALARAEAAVARGEPVQVADLWAMRSPLDEAAVAREQQAAEVQAGITLLDRQIVQLETELSATLPAAGNLAAPGAIREARAELRRMEQTRVDVSDAAARTLAKQIQAREGVSYKAALSTAKKQLQDRSLEWQAKSDRLNTLIDSNAEAQRQTQRSVELRRQLDTLNERRTSEQARLAQTKRDPVAALADGLLQVRQAANPELTLPTVEASPPVARAPQGKPRDLQTELIALRKQDAILTKLQECLNG